MACSSNSNTYGPPSNGRASLDPRATINNPAGPGSAYYQPPASSSTAGSSTSAAPSGPQPMQLLDIGLPSYRPAPNLSRIYFYNHADADPAGGPPSGGIPLSDFRTGTGYRDRMEDPVGFPFAPMYPGMENNIEIEMNWPGYMRYSFQLSISSRRWHFREAYADHITRADLGSTISQQASHYFRMAQLESSMPSPVPLGTSYTEGVTTNDVILRSLDPMISPEGRVVWVPHFVARFPLGEGHTRPFTQRTRW